jgi:hypothetical protein
MELASYGQGKWWERAGYLEWLRLMTIIHGNQHAQAVLTGQNQLYVSLEGCAILVTRHRRVWVMRFNQLATRNVQKRIRTLRKWSEGNKIHDMTRELLLMLAVSSVSETAPTINYGWKLECKCAYVGGFIIHGGPSWFWLCVGLDYPSPKKVSNHVFNAHWAPEKNFQHISIPTNEKFLVCQTWSSSLMSFLLPPSTTPSPPIPILIKAFQSDEKCKQKMENWLV